MITRPSLELTCDHDHRGGPSVVALLTDCRRLPWPASPDDLAVHEAMCAQLVPGRTVTPSPEPIYGIAVTYLTYLRPGRGNREDDWRQKGLGGRVVISDGRRTYTFRCRRDYCHRKPVPVGAQQLDKLMDSAIRDGVRSKTLTELRREIRPSPLPA